MDLRNIKQLGCGSGNSSLGRQAVPALFKGGPQRPALATPCPPNQALHQVGGVCCLSSTAIKCPQKSQVGKSAARHKCLWL